MNYKAPTSIKNQGATRNHCITFIRFI